MKSYRFVLYLLCVVTCATLACQKEMSSETGRTVIDVPAVADSAQLVLPPANWQKITLKNPSFEDSLHSWKKLGAYKGKNGFRARGYAAITGKLGLSFYASQPQHYSGAKQETPWNGKIYQPLTGLADGHYTYRIWTGAVGNGMYLWADGGAGEVKVLIKSSKNELNTLDFDVRGGSAKIGFVCIDAGGPQRFAPYFSADDAELLRH